jgi:activating signal cointegrator complex subunit 2
VHNDINNDLGQDRTARATEGATATPFGGAEVATASGSRAVDSQVEEVRAILPDYAPAYIRALLRRSEYGNIERVVEALLEGTAPLAPPEAIQQQATLKAQTPPQAPGAFEYTRDLRNVFDGEDMETSRMRIGKKKRFFVLLFLSTVYHQCA